MGRDQSESSFINKTILSDEYVLHVEGKVKKYNVRMLVLENTHETQKYEKKVKSSSLLFSFI